MNQGCGRQNLQLPLLLDENLGVQYSLYQVVAEYQQQQQALFTFCVRIIIVTVGSFSLTVRYMQCNKRRT